MIADIARGYIEIVHNFLFTDTIMPLTKVCTQCSSIEHCKRFVIKHSQVSSKAKLKNKLSMCLYVSMSKTRAVETEPESILRKAMNRKSMSKARTVESEPESILRKAMNRKSMSKARTVESEPESILRKAMNRKSMSKARTEPESILRKSKDKQLKSKARSVRQSLKSNE